MPEATSRQLTLYKCWPDAPDPHLATNDLSGEIPARALRFCEPFLVANSAGVLINSPINMTLVWSGSEVLAEIEGVEETILVDRLFLPDYGEYWSTIAPPEAADVIPPFIEAFPERGVLQIWTGAFVRTPPGVSSWVRGPVNRNPGSAASVIEGVVETDWWTGPLFFVLEIRKTDHPVVFRRDEPMVQVVPVLRSALSCSAADAVAESVKDAPQDFWMSLVANARRRNSGSPGSYRREARRAERSAIQTT